MLPGVPVRREWAEQELGKDSSHKFLKGLSVEAGGALTGLQGKNLSRPEVRLVGTFVCVSSSLGTQAGLPSSSLFRALIIHDLGRQT